MAILLPVILYLSFHLLGWQYPALFWGTDQLSYYPWPVGAAFVLVVLALLLVSTKVSWALRADQFAAARLCRFPFERRWFQALLLLCFLLLAYILRDSTHLLNDKGMWLSTFLHLQFYRLGQTLWGWTAQATYEWLSLLAGAAYLAVLWKTVGLLSQNLIQRLTSLALLATLGSIQLFFGYGESYTLVTLAASAYLYTALRALRGHSLLRPSLWLGLAIALHAIALSLLPSWIYLLWKRSGQPWKQQLHTPRIYVPLILGAALIGLFLYTAFYPARLPLWTPQEPGKYALLSLPHLLQLLNALLLLSPFGLVWGLVWGRRGTGEPFFHLLGWALLGSGILFCMHDAFLGGRDWDLLAFPALFYTLWGISALDQADTPPHHWAQIRLTVLPLMALHTALWLGINAHSERAITRLGNLLQYSNQTHHYQAFSRGHYYLDVRKNPDQAIPYFREAIALASPDTSENVRRYAKTLGKALTTAGHGGEAVAIFEQTYARQKNPFLYQYDLDFHYYWARASLQWGEEQYQQRKVVRAESIWKEGIEHYLELGTQYERQGDHATATALWQEAVAHSQKLLSLHPTASLYHQAGRGFQALGHYDEAIESYRQSAALAQDADGLYWTYVFLARNLQVTQRRQEAIEALRAALNLRPQSAETHFALGILYYTDHQFDQAVSAFQTAIALAPHNPQGHVNLGTALQAAGRLAEAEEAYREATRLQTDLGLSPEINRGELKNQWNQ